MSARPVLSRRIIGLVMASALLVALVARTLPHLRGAMYGLTGEEALWEQVKGTGAVALLAVRGHMPETDPYRPIAHVGLSPYGVNTFLEQEVEEDKVERSLQMISQAGFQWIRQEFPWEDIEIAAKGDFWDHHWNRSAWDKYDRIVSLAAKYGLTLIVRLDNPPAWSRAIGNAEGWTLAPPDDPNNYGDFVSAVVSRYRGQVRYYQIWNEPNIFPEWGDQPADPAGYVELLRIAYRRAKEADPDCVIIAAGLAQTVENAPLEFGPRNMSDLVYLERMYQGGAQGSFDIMGAMVYGLWTGPADRRASPDRTNFARAQLIREIMVRHGDGDKPIWATEVGWDALPVDFAGAANYGRVTMEQQARYAVEAYARAAREWPWMGVMNYWFFRRPSTAERDQSWYYFRMVEPDFTPLPVYHALSAAAQAAPVLGIGFHQENHWGVRYEGDWRAQRDAEAVLGGVAIGGPGARATFAFHGTGLTIVLRDAASAASLRVAIDGSAIRLRPTAAPYSAAPAFSAASHLRNARHSVEITVSGEPVALDGLVVRRDPARWPWFAAGAAAGGASIALATARRRRRP